MVTQLAGRARVGCPERRLRFCWATRPAGRSGGAAGGRHERLRDFCLTAKLTKPFTTCSRPNTGLMQTKPSETILYLLQLSSQQTGSKYCYDCNPDLITIRKFLSYQPRVVAPLLPGPPPARHSLHLTITRATTVWFCVFCIITRSGMEGEKAGKLCYLLVFSSMNAFLLFRLNVDLY